MREDERHLVEVPRAQLSRLSHLVVDLRRNQENLPEYPSFDKIAKAVLNNDLVSLFRGIADLIMETVYPA
jgi:hypothetical protein